MEIIKKINGAITAKYKLFIGIICLIAAVVIEIVTDFNFFYSDIIAVIVILGMLSITCAVASGIFKMNIPYIAYMPVNCIGALCCLYTISRAPAIGPAYVIIFNVIIFFALWISEILILNKKSPAVRILGGLLVNALTIVMTGLGILAIITAAIILAPK